MILVDLLILSVLAVSTISAFIHGFFVELFSLLGLIAGVVVACGNYVEFSFWITRWVHNPAASRLCAFLLIALGVMLLASLVGRLIRSAVRMIGLGFLDRLLGAVFGFMKGCLLVTLGMMAIAAFLPRADWLRNSKLAPVFLAAAHDGSQIAPVELGEKIRGFVR